MRLSVMRLQLLAGVAGLVLLGSWCSLGVAQPSVEVFASRSLLVPGDELCITVIASNAGAWRNADLWVGIIDTKGTVYALWPQGTWETLLAPMATSLPLPRQSSITLCFAITLPSQSPPICSPGTYLLAAGLSTPGTAHFICQIDYFQFEYHQDRRLSGMVRLPAGEFEMGDANGLGQSDEQPVHRVYLDEFFIDEHEVTNADYAKFLEATGHEPPPFWSSGAYHTGPAFANFPVVGVSWYDADAYCRWRGKRLPTEAEWEKAARAGLLGQTFPWGSQPATCDKANFSPCNSSSLPVKSFSPNQAGIFDMAGNVWEWVSDWYDPDYYSRSPYANPSGPSTGGLKVLRGGSWFTLENQLRCANRAYNNPTAKNFFDVGFRCACRAGRKPGAEPN